MCDCCFALVVPYYFALSNLSLSIDALVNPGLVNVTTSIEQTKKYASNGMIDPTRNMLMDRVFVYHGANDTRVFTGHTTSFNLRFFLLRKQQLHIIML